MHDDVKRFATVVETFCGVVENVDGTTKAAFLQRMDELLPLVYCLAQRLPYPFHRENDDNHDPSARHPRPIAMTVPKSRELQARQRDRIGGKLEPHRWFHFVHDPVDPGDRNVIEADLADILSDVYVGLKEGLILYSRSSDVEQAYAVSDWRNAVDSLWGRYVVEAMLPIHSLIHWHYDEHEEVFDI